MTQPAENEKCYLGCLPKEEVPKFFERLKGTLATEKKTGDKKEFEVEIRGTKDDPKGIAFETFTVTKDEFSKYFDPSKDYMAKGLLAFSFGMAAKDDSGVETLKQLLEKMKPMIEQILGNKKDKYQIYFRNDGKKVFLDVVSIEGKIVQPLLDLGVNLAEYTSFKASFKTNLDLKKLFADGNDSCQSLAELLSFVISLKGTGDNVKYLAGAISGALKDVKLNNEKFQAKFDKVVGFLNVVNAFIGSKLKVEFDGKELAGLGSSAAKEVAGGDLNAQLSGYQMMVKQMGPSFVKPALEQYGLVEPAKQTNIDEVTLSFGIPKFQNAIVQLIKIPGLTDLLVDFLK